MIRNLVEPEAQSEARGLESLPFIPFSPHFVKSYSAFGFVASEFLLSD